MPEEKNPEIISVIPATDSLIFSAFPGYFEYNLIDLYTPATLPNTGGSATPPFATAMDSIDIDKDGFSDFRFYSYHNNTFGGSNGMGGANLIIQYEWSLKVLNNNISQKGLLSCDIISSQRLKTYFTGDTISVNDADSSAFYLRPGYPVPVNYIGYRILVNGKWKAGWIRIENNDSLTAYCINYGTGNYIIAGDSL